MGWRTPTHANAHTRWLFRTRLALHAAASPAALPHTHKIRTALSRSRSRSLFLSLSLFTMRSQHTACALHLMRVQLSQRRRRKVKSLQNRMRKKTAAAKDRVVAALESFWTPTRSAASCSSVAAAVVVAVAVVVTRFHFACGFSCHFTTVAVSYLCASSSSPSLTLHSKWVLDLKRTHPPAIGKANSNSRTFLLVPLIILFLFRFVLSPLPISALAVRCKKARETRASLPAIAASCILLVAISRLNASLCCCWLCCRSRGGRLV